MAEDHGEDPVTEPLEEHGIDPAEQPDMDLGRTTAEPTEDVGRVGGAATASEDAAAEDVAAEEGAAGPADGTPAFRHERERHGLVGPFSGRQLAGALVAVLAIVVLLVVATTPLAQLGSTAPGDPRPTAYVLSREPVAGLKPGDLAPPLQVPLSGGGTYQLTDLQGHPVDLAALRGRAVWVNFWASWCPPCQAETPVLRDMATRYQDKGLTIVGISVQETSEADVQAYADRYGLDYVVAADLQGLIFHAYKVYALPTQFFIDPTGVIRRVVQGPMDEATAISIVEPMLPGAPGAAAPAGSAAAGSTPGPSPSPAASGP